MGQTESGPELGYHVLQVAPNSPGERAGLVPYFDFIVSVNGHMLDKEDKLLENTLKDSVGKEVDLLVYSSRYEQYRKVKVIPSDTWGGAGVAGISIRFCSFSNATAHVWHILDVYPNSPASIACLEPHTDYIVGTVDLLFNSSEDFYTLVRGSIGKSVPLYVYSSKTNRVRLVDIQPNRTWGGNGCLGCDVGYGYIHRIPSPPLEETPPPQSITPKPTSIPLNPTPISTVIHTSSALSPSPGNSILRSDVPDILRSDVNNSDGNVLEPVENLGNREIKNLESKLEEIGFEEKDSTQVTSNTSIVF